ncbi:hypothetical protein CLAIMM_07476 [Cladophialophora immunda]|nr:hypothetical protein CLAIMM_07476 [Cladophialophora immunda]
MNGSRTQDGTSGEKIARTDMDENHRPWKENGFLIQDGTWRMEMAKTDMVDLNLHLGVEAVGTVTAIHAVNFLMAQEDVNRDRAGSGGADTGALVMEANREGIQLEGLSETARITRSPGEGRENANKAWREELMGWWTG